MVEAGGPPMGRRDRPIGALAGASAVPLMKAPQQGSQGTAIAALEPHGAVTLPQIGGGPTVGRRRGPIGALPPWLDFLERHLSLTGS